jgi:acyl-CoA hydrolase
MSNRKIGAQRITMAQVFEAIVEKTLVKKSLAMCSHIDHSEHSVQVVVTERGMADLRGWAPVTRTRRIIDNCAHPAYLEALHRYLEEAPMGHIRHDLRRCFDLHLNYLEHGAILPELDLTIFEPIRSRDRAMVNSRR